MHGEVSLKQAFVIQHVGPTGSEIRLRADRVMECLIEPACRETGYDAVRADQLPAELIVEPIVSALATSALVIADLGRPPWNANVLMEVGFRLATGRPIVFLADVEPATEALPLHLQNRRILAVNSAEPTADCVSNLCDYITHQQLEMYGWRSHYPILEFKVPLRSSADPSFVFANEAAVDLYGLENLEGLLAMSVCKADARLKGYMPARHREAFAADQDRLFGKVVNRVNRSPAMAKIPAWFTSHPKPEYNGRAFWPILLQHKFSSHQDDSIVMRVAFVDVTEWDAHGPDSRDPSSVVKIPTVFRDRHYKYDIFMSYNSLDRETVRELTNAFRRFGLMVWFDQDNLVDNRGLYRELKLAMYDSRIIVAVLGRNGFGPWQENAELADEFLSIVKGGRSFVLLLLHDLPVEDNGWLQSVPREYKTILRDRLYVPLPSVEELRDLEKAPDRPLRFVERMVDLLSRAIHPEEDRD